MSDRTYRRVCAAPLASGEAAVRDLGGGRGRVNRWHVRNPRSAGPAGSAAAAAPQRRAVPPAGARPLLATVAEPDADRLLAATPCQDQTVSAPNRPALSGVSSDNPGQPQTLSPQTPAQTPAEIPAPYVRARREPQDPRTSPPDPPEGGTQTDSIVVEGSYLTERGRRRRRHSTIELAPIRQRLKTAGKEDCAAWKRVRALLLQAVGENTFEIWLEPLELIAVDRDGMLLVTAPDATASWIGDRYGRLLSACGERAGRALRLGDEAERAAAQALGPAIAIGPPGRSHIDVHDQAKEASG